MLDTAVSLVHEHGLTVSLQHISLEALAVDAGVARSAVYRVWPNREDFFDELLIRLGESPESSPSVFDRGTLAEAITALNEARASDSSALSSAEKRRAVLVEICRRGATKNYENVLAHESWRTYIALSASAMSYREPMKSKLRTVIAQTQAQYVSTMAVFYERIGDVLGRRIRTEFASDPSSGRHSYAYLSAAGSAAMEGMVLRSANFPRGHSSDTISDLSAPTVSSDPFNTGHLAAWIAPAVTFTATFLAMTEAVPDDEYGYTAAELTKKIERILEDVNMFDVEHIFGASD